MQRGEWADKHLQCVLAVDSPILTHCPSSKGSCAQGAASDNALHAGAGNVHISNEKFLRAISGTTTVGELEGCTNYEADIPRFQQEGRVDCDLDRLTRDLLVSILSMGSQCNLAQGDTPVA